MYNKLLSEDVDGIIIDAPLTDYWTQFFCGSYTISETIV